MTATAAKAMTVKASNDNLVSRELVAGFYTSQQGGTTYSGGTGGRRDIIFHFHGFPDPEAAAVTSVDKRHGARTDTLSAGFCWYFGAY